MAGSKGSSGRIAEKKKKEAISKKRPELEPIPETSATEPASKRRKSEPAALPPKKRGPTAKKDSPSAPQAPVSFTESLPVVETQKRGRKPVQRSTSVNVAMTQAPKRVKLEVLPRQNRGTGTLYVFGTNISGQFGFGYDVVDKRKYPALVPYLQEKQIQVVEVAAGGMHTVVLTGAGEVYTFGCNDDFALGRPSENEENNFQPALVKLPEKVEQVSAGDSHTVALTSNGNVYAWGTFRDGNGPMGLLPSPAAVHQKEPQRIMLNTRIGLKVIKVASGENHFLMLTESGSVYSVGVAELGQLGRRNRVLRSSTLSPTDYCLSPLEIAVPVRKTFNDIWAGGNVNFCKADKTGEIWVFGMNSTHQLALDEPGTVVELPTKSSALSAISWKEIAAGAFHCLGLDTNGRVYSWGKFEDGRLGLGDLPTADVPAPTLIPALAAETFVHVACGSSVSYAVTTTGQVYAFGFGENWQLGNGQDDDQNEPALVKISIKQQVANGVIYASAGGQHASLIATQPFV